VGGKKRDEKRGIKEICSANPQTAHFPRMGSVAQWMITNKIIHKISGFPPGVCP
jgi:hypothetical protein